MNRYQPRISTASAVRVCQGLNAALSFCRRHKGERPSYELEGIYDEDFKRDWETYK